MDTNGVGGSEVNLQEKDVNLIHAIQEEELTSFTFEGLKRMLVMHSETLSRTLSRLLDQGFVEKHSEGYGLTSKAVLLCEGESLVQKSVGLNVLQTLLPGPQVVQKVVLGLKGCWFGRLRWLGYSESVDEVVLKWITEDGGTVVSAVFGEGLLKINAKVLSGNQNDLVLIASHELMGHITKLISSNMNN